MECFFSFSFFFPGRHREEGGERRSIFLLLLLSPSLSRFDQRFFSLSLGLSIATKVPRFAFSATRLQFCSLWRFPERDERREKARGSVRKNTSAIGFSTTSLCFQPRVFALTFTPQLYSLFFSLSSSSFPFPTFRPDLRRLRRAGPHRLQAHGRLPPHLGQRSLEVADQARALHGQGQVRPRVGGLGLALCVGGGCCCRGGGCGSER